MLELVNLTKIYHSETEGSLALKGISVKFPEKGFVAVTGESGSGKTTLLNVLSGFVSYEEGDFFIDGQDFLSFSDEDLEKYRKNDIGFVFQDYHLIESHTVIDNLIEALLIVGVDYRTAKKKAEECLKKFDLYEQRNNKARNISSGQKQKLSIARAIIKEPRIVLCDEPTANLDPETGLAILSILGEYAKNHLVIVSTHNYEDAQSYATHFMRMYKGTLTAFEEIAKVDEEKVVAPNQQKVKSTSLFLTFVKNQVSKSVSKVGFFAAFVAIFVFLIALFSANVDDATTKVLSREIFNNINQNELIIMRKDRENISEDDLDILRNISHVEATQLYGLATEMNYYYREDVDYKNQVTIYREADPASPGSYIEYTQDVFTVIKDDMYIKSYKGIIDETDLASGKLPEAYNEIAVYGDYELGQEIKIYFHDPVMQGTSYFPLDFKVVGLLKNYHDDAYFSPLFLKGIDYIQYHSNTTLFRLSMRYRIYNRFKGVYENKKVTVESFTPLYNPKLGPNEVQFAFSFVDNFTSFPEIEDISSIETYLYNHEDEKISCTLQEDIYSKEIASYFVYVGENVFNSYVTSHESNTARVFVDDYSNLDEVISKLTNQKYDCLSEYRAGSREYDVDKQIQRAIILIASLVVFVVMAVLYFFFGYIFDKSRLVDDKTLSLLGLPYPNLRKVAFLHIASATILGVVLGFLIYFIVSLLPIPFIININKYLRFYHFFIVLGTALILGLLIWLKYTKVLLKNIRKVNRS